MCAFARACVFIYFVVVIVVAFCPLKMIVSGRSINLTTLFLGVIRPPKRMPIFSPVAENCPS